MTRLIAALQALGLEGEIALAGRWLTLAGDRYTIYVVETTLGRGYYTWGQDPDARVVEFYSDPAEAIKAGLRRASYTWHARDEPGPGT